MIEPVFARTKFDRKTPAVYTNRQIRCQIGVVVDGGNTQFAQAPPPPTSHRQRLRGSERAPPYRPVTPGRNRLMRQLRLKPGGSAGVMAETSRRSLRALGVLWSGSCRRSAEAHLHCQKAGAPADVQGAASAVPIRAARRADLDIRRAQATPLGRCARRRTPSARASTLCRPHAIGG